MKKYIVLLLSVILALSLCACGNSSKQTDGVPNPVKEVKSLEELAKEMNCAMIKPEEVEITDEVFTIIDGEPVIGDYSFKVDGKDCMVRFADADINTDISGIYMGDEKDGTLYEKSTNDHAHYIENDLYKATRWFTTDGQYIFAVKDDGEWDWFAYENMMKQFRDMAPVNWTSDVAYEDYKALEGTYINDDENIAMINFYMDYVEVYAMHQGKEGNIVWEAISVLDGDQLKYESARSYIVTYNEEKNKSEQKDIESEKAGSMTIKDRKLSFDHVKDSHFKGMSYKLQEN